MESGGLLRPMPADALIRRPAPQKAAPGRNVRFLEPEADPETLRAPVLMPKPEKPREPEEEMDVLISAFAQEEEDDEPLEDAVPTGSMPVPVCVPLYEAPAEKKRSRWWVAPLVIALVIAGGYAAWEYDLLFKLSSL